GAPAGRHAHSRTDYSSYAYSGDADESAEYYPPQTTVPSRAAEFLASLLSRELATAAAAEPADVAVVTASAPPTSAEPDVGTQHAAEPARAGRAADEVHLVSMPSTGPAAEAPPQGQAQEFSGP